MTEDDVRRTGWSAWRAFAAACLDGDWEPFVALMHPDVEFWMPPPGFQDGNRGLARLRDFARHTVEVRGSLRFAEPMRVLQHGSVISFEAEDEGTIAGQAVTNRIAMFFEVRDGRVVRFHEYIGKH